MSTDTAPPLAPVGLVDPPVVRSPQPAPPAAPAKAPVAAGRENWVVPLAVLIVGMFMSVLDTSIVNVALPTMARDFGVTTDDIEWVATAYTLALGVIVPLSALTSSSSELLSPLKKGSFGMSKPKSERRVSRSSSFSTTTRLPLSRARESSAAALS